MHKGKNIVVRDNSLDIARALCVLYIVGFWHIAYYIPKGYFIETEKNEILSTITMSVLGVFTFISGYFLKKYTFRTFSEVSLFYINRFKRFYILFALSLITLYFTGGTKWISSISVLLLSLFGGLSVLLPPAPSTLWYFCMLILFYLCTPLLLYSNSIIYRFLNSIVVLALFTIASKYSGMDKILLFYFIIYSVGLNTPNRFYAVLGKYKYLLFLLSLLLFTVLCNYYHIAHSAIKISNSLTFIVTILTFSQILSSIKNSTFAKIYSFVGYASMAAYLFHRQIYDTVYFLSSLENIVLTPAIMYLIVIPTVFVLGYYIQKTYDSILNHKFSDTKN